MSLPRGPDLLHDPRLNKSTAFTEAEREKLGLLGLLPEGIDDLDAQIRRAQVQLDAKTTDLERYIYLSQLQDTDETLFYRLLMSDPALADPVYRGLRQPRSSDEELDAFVDEFVDAVQEEFPRCCIQFEDWAGPDAIRLLARYRDTVCCFNDDIQGTAAVALAGLFGALRITGTPLAAQRLDRKSTRLNSSHA